MTSEMQIEISMILRAFALGICMRLAFGGLEILRMRFFHGRVCAACMDILYWMAAACAVYGLMYRYASGALRGMIILCSMLGLVFMTAVDRKIAKMLKKRAKNC